MVVKTLRTIILRLDLSPSGLQTSQNSSAYIEYASSSFTVFGTEVIQTSSKLIGRRVLSMWFTDALLPEFCVRCKREGSVFCSACRAAWSVDPIVDHELFSLGSYKDKVLQTLLGLWKYHNVTHAREVLLDLVEQTVRDYHWTFPEVEAVTFVPLHWRKHNERGFDQAEEIGKCVAASLGVPCLPLLERTRYTAQQAQIDREARDRREFEGVFSSVGETRGHVILVDDVWTTGTTIGSAAAALKAAGAASVSAFTVARG